MSKDSGFAKKVGYQVGALYSTSNGHETNQAGLPLWIKVNPDWDIILGFLDPSEETTTMYAYLTYSNRFTVLEVAKHSQ